MLVMDVSELWLMFYRIHGVLGCLQKLLLTLFDFGIFYPTEMKIKWKMFIWQEQQ